MTQLPRRWFAPLIPTALALGLALLVAGLALGAPAALARQDPQAGVAGVPDPTLRIVHASPDAPAVDVLVDGQPAAQNVAFGSATEYAPLAPGDHQVQVVPTGGGEPLIDQPVTLAGGTAYVLAVVGPAAGLQLQVQQVDLGTIAPGQARLRVIQTIPDAPAVDVGVAGVEEPLVGGVAFQGAQAAPAGDAGVAGGDQGATGGLGAPATGGDAAGANAGGYQDVAAGTYDLEVRTTDTDQVLAAVPGVRVEPGQAYDLFVLGQAGGQDLRLLPLATRVNAPCGEVLGLGEASASCLRVVHASPDAGPVDVYLGEAPAVQGLEYGGATEFVAGPSGQQRLRVVPAGGTPDQAVLDSNQDLGSGQAYQLTISGLAAQGAEEPLTAWLAGVDLSPLPQNQARVRVVHASPDTEPVDVAVAGGQTPFDAIAYGSQSGYVAFDAGTYGLQLRLDAGDTLLREAQGVQLQPGFDYDVYAIGQSEDGTLQVVVLAAEAGIQQGAVAEAGTPMAAPMVTPASEVTPVIAAGATPVVVTPGAATPAATPTS